MLVGVEDVETGELEKCYIHGLGRYQEDGGW